MTKVQNADINMIDATLQLCKEEEQTLSTIPAFKDAQETLQNKRDEIKATMQESIVPVSGIITDTADHREMLIERSFATAGSVIAYAAKNKDEALKAKVNYTRSDLQRMKGNTLVVVSRSIYGTAKELGDKLKNFGTTDEKLVELELTIDAFDVKSRAPRIAIVRRSTKTKGIDPLIREAKDILKSEIDPLFRQLKESHPNLCITYENIRSVVDPRVSTTRLSGVITVEATKEPYSGAIVRVEQAGTEMATDPDGTYNIGIPKSGFYTIHIIAPGFATQVIKNVRLKRGKNTILNISL